MKKEFIKELNKSPPTEVFIDTIEAEGLAYALIGKDFGWEHHGEGDFWTKAVRHNHCVVFFTFKADKKSKGCLSKKGNIKVKFSVPKLYYGDNFTGVYCSDCSAICRIIDMLLVENFVLVTEREFSGFKVVRVDRSVCSDAVTPERIKEMLRLFSLLYFPYHTPGMRCSKEYDYETSFCHTSDSEDILCYDKSIEFKAHSKEKDGDLPKGDTDEDDTGSPSVTDNIFRVEICSKGALEFYGDFGTVKDVLTSNKDFINLLEHHKLCLDFAPKDEYWKLVTSCFSKEKEIYLSDPNRDSKPYPRYITRRSQNVYSFLKYINENGGAAAHKEKDELYNDCVEFTGKLGISVIYTKLNERVNFFERFYRRLDTDRIFLRDKADEWIYVDIDIPENINEIKKEFNKNIHKLASDLKSAKTILIAKSKELLSSVYTKITYHKRE